MTHALHVPGTNGQAGDPPAMLETIGLAKTFPVRHGLLRRSAGRVHAVSEVDLSIARGTTLGLVGESGSGKSTLARLVMRLLEPTAGQIRVDGRDVAHLHGDDLTWMRDRVQMVFQDPFSSFNPLATIGTSIAEPLHAHRHLNRREREGRSADMLELVGLSSRYVDRYPSELSGGQLQRAAIARALTIQPDLVVLDEPVSALDVSTQAQVINSLLDLQSRLSVTLLFIAHDLAVVRHVSERIAVMYLGQIVEEGPAEQVYTAPRHPYTAALISAIPVPDPQRQRSRQRILLHGDIPSPMRPPSGCRFRTRCPFAMDMCAEVPPVTATPGGGRAACHLHSSGPMLAGAPLPDGGTLARSSRTT